MGLTRIRAEQISDIDYKQATRVIALDNINLSGGAPKIVDGVNLNTNDRVLVAGQSTASQNGIYYVSVAGTGSNGTWARTNDSNTTGEINAGMIVMVTEGNTYADTSWKLITDDPIVIGVTALVFLQNTGNSFNIINVVGSANVVANGVSSTVAFASGNNISITGNATTDTITFDVVQSPSFTGNVSGANILTAGLISATGNAQVGNILTAGLISATGNVTGNYFIGNGSQLTGIITSVSNVVNGSSNLNINAANANVTISVSTIGNVAVFAPTGASVLGTVTANGNVTGGNILTAGLISATGNAQAGNITTAGLVSAAGNVYGNAFITNGSGGGVSASGNIQAGNLLTAGFVSATGNATAGNILTAGIVSAGGNITGANITTTGLLSVTGNITTNSTVTTANIYGASGVTIATGGNANINLYPGGTGNIVLPSGNATYINNLALNPVQDNDAATKYYVDTLASTGIAYHPPVYVATTANLATTTGGSITYAQPNGAGNGIGATITTTGSFNLIDTGNVQTVGTRILVKTEGNAVLNGIYTWSNATVIVRSTDADQYGSDSAEALSINDYFFVTGGNVNAGSSFIVNSPAGTITFGTSNITFAQFSSSQTYTSGNGISIAGTVINAKVDNVTTAFDGGGNIVVKASANLTTPNIGAATGTSLSATSTITGGNILSAGVVSATGNVYANTFISPGSGGTLSGSGNIIGGNILTAGVVSATGNVTGNYFIGNGSQLTGVAASNVNANALIGNTLSSNVLISSLTAVGTLSVLSVSGNATAGNIATAGLISATGNVTGNYIVGNGSLLTSITGANVSGTVANATYALSAGSAVGTAATVTTNAQPNITSVGTLTSLSVSGNTTSGNILTGGIVSATGNTQAGNILTAGLLSATSNVTGGNILTAGLISATSTITSAANIIGGNITTAGLLSATGNVYANTFISPGSGGTLSGSGNIIGGNILTAGVVSATGNVTGNYFIGNGSQLTGVAASNVNANALIGNTLSSNVLISSLTAVGTLSVLGVSGNTTTGNLLTGGLISATGNATAGNITTVGLISATGNVTAGNVTTAGLISATGNATAGNITTAGLISATGNINGGNVIITGVLVDNTGNLDLQSTAANGNINLTPNGTGIVTVSTQLSAAGNVTGNYFIGNGSQLTGISTSAGSNISNGTSNVTVVGANANITVGVSGIGNVAVFAPTGISVLGTVAANGNVTGGNILTAGLISATGNVTANNISGNLLASTASVSGNVVAGNVTTSGTISVGGIVLSGNLIVGAGPTLTIDPNGSGGTDGNVVITGNLTVQGTTTTINSNTISTNDLTINMANNAANATAANNGGIEVGPVGSPYATLLYNTASNVWVANLGISSVGNLSTGANVIATGNVSGGNIITSNNISAGGNVLTGGLISATSNVTGGNILTAGLISSTGTATVGNLVTSGTVSGSGNITGSNILTSGLVSAAGNIYASGAVIAGSGSGGNLSGANVISANTFNAVIVSASGNVTGNYFIGNGSQLTGIITSVSNVVNGASNLNIGAANANVTISVSTIGNVAVFTPTGASVLGTVVANGNVTGGNVTTAGVISATGNVTGNYFIGNGSQLTGIVASGGAAITNGNSNVTVGANANITVGVSGIGNVVVFAPTGEYVTGEVSATGNITGSYIYGNGAFLTGISGGGGGGANIANGTSNVNISTANGNITVGVSGVGNVVIITPDGLSASGNIYGNTFISDGSGGGISAPGNITGGNILTSGYVSATGNVYGNYFIGNGSQLTGVTATATNISNGSSNITIATANANVAISVSTVGNVAVFTPTTVNITGNISASGNIVAGGVRSTSSASAPTNPTTGDFWFDTSTNVQYRFTFDGTNYYWIDDFGATVSTQPLFTGPVVFNNVSTQTNGRKGVFALKNNQANVAGIANTKQLQVTANGLVQTSFVNTWVWPFWCVTESFNGVKVTKLGYTATANSVVFFRPPAKRTQVSITQVNTATDSQLLRYPFSATTIAISD